MGDLTVWPEQQYDLLKKVAAMMIYRYYHKLELNENQFKIVASPFMDRINIQLNRNLDRGYEEEKLIMGRTPVKFRANL